MHTATIVIPAYNEEKNIADVIRRIRKVSGKYEIIVVDDGSADKTGEIARKEGVKAIRLGKNMGKAFACLKGSAEARSEKIVFIDADLQLQPEEIPLFVKALEGCDLAVGVREMKNIPIQRRISNSIAKKLVGGTSDALCGFRAIRKKALMEMNIQSRRYEFEAEMVINARKMGLKIREVPVSVSYDSYKGMGFGDSLRVLLFILKKRLEK
jgi:glycosyltransferase involved in cell wall biosynthesis